MVEPVAVSDSNSSRPARPHHKLTEDGRVFREVLSYSRRGSRFTHEKQAKAWEAHHEDWVIPDAAVDQPGFSFASYFESAEPRHERPLYIEIGSGIGENTAAVAAAHPEIDILAIEVWRPGVAETLARLAEVGASNVRLCQVDAAWSIEHLVPDASVQEFWTFFPDPWHKERHKKRRLVSPAFAQVIARKLVPGGVWRLATDWQDYADHMLEVLNAEPLLEGGVVERWAERPLTKFERKGINAGRSITDLAYTRHLGG